MNCTDAYREALTRHFSSTGSLAPTSTPAPSRRKAAKTAREGNAGRPLRRRTDPGQDDPESPGAAAAGADAVAESCPAMALAEDVTVEGGSAHALAALPRETMQVAVGDECPALLAAN